MKHLFTTQLLNCATIWLYLPVCDYYYFNLRLTFARVETMNIKTKDRRDTWRDVMLTVGTLGIMVSVFMLMLSVITTIKIAKVTILGLLLLSSIAFYKGMDPKLQKRLKDTVKVNVDEYWQKLNSFRQVALQR